MGKKNKKIENQNKVDKVLVITKENRLSLDKIDALIILGIILFTLALRIYSLALPNKLVFDEVHYVPAARDYIEGKADRNDVHPPLAKEMMAVFIKTFGDTTVGWRMGSVIFGTLMVVIIYLLSILLFQNRIIAVLSSLLLSTEFLHLVQSRIATLDIYIGFFILLGYYFTWLSYRGLRLQKGQYKKNIKKTVVYIILSAFFFGCSVAVKISGIAGAMGAYLFLIIALFIDKKKPPIKELGLVALVFIIVIPIVFLLTHIPLFIVMKGRVPMDKLLYKKMFKFHYTQKFTHPYLSQMWQWPTVHRPIWYHWVKCKETSKVSGIIAVGNLLFWWSFFVVLVDMIYRAIREKDRRIIFILCGYLPLYLFWLTSFSKHGGKWHLKGGFFYYMLPCVPFMALGVAETLNDLMDNKIGKVSVTIYLIGILGFLILFYPILTGIPVPQKYYEQIMKVGIFKSWV